MEGSATIFVLALLATGNSQETEMNGTEVELMDAHSPVGQGSEEGSMSRVDSGRYRGESESLEGNGFGTTIIFTDLYSPGPIEDTTEDSTQDQTYQVSTQEQQEVTMQDPATEATTQEVTETTTQEVTETTTQARITPAQRSSTLRKMFPTDRRAKIVQRVLRPRTTEPTTPIPEVPVTETTYPPESSNQVLPDLPVVPDLPDLPQQDSIYELEQSQYLAERHPCSRECLLGAQPLTCRYKFVVEYYNSMSKACYNCPYNVTDCYRDDCVPTDGVKRTLVTINRRVPGTSIEVCRGDKVEVLVENRLMDGSTSIHWHGLHQHASPHMDGVPYVTQCPIQPGAAFLYTFLADTAGTHFYHSHSGIQRGDGAFGALVVRSPFYGDLYDMDLSEHTIVVLDWSHRLGTVRFTDHHHAGGDNKPDTLQVNGRGTFTEFLDPQTNLTLRTPPATFTVTQGYRYRFRLINAGVLNCPIEVSIDNHKMMVIASDGNDILPETVERLVTYAGERWDFVLRATEAEDNYWVRFRGLMDCDERFTSAHQGAVLHYQGAPSTLPSTPLQYASDRKGRVVNALNAGKVTADVTLVPELGASSTAADLALQPRPDHTVLLAYDFHPLDNPHFHRAAQYGFSEVLNMPMRTYTPQLNHISLRLPSSPLLSQPEDLPASLSCANKDPAQCASSYCECTNIINVGLGSVVEVILVDEGVTYDANHPFHLHGHNFRVVAMDRLGRNTTAANVLALDLEGKLVRNLRDPPIKDTVTVPDGGYTIIRFHADNPGYWLFHCHIEFHVEIGMAVVFKVGENEDMLPPPRGFPRCGDFLPSSVTHEGIRRGQNVTADRRQGVEERDVPKRFDRGNVIPAEVRGTDNEVYWSDNSSWGEAEPETKINFRRSSASRVYPWLWLISAFVLWQT